MKTMTNNEYFNQNRDQCAQSWGLAIARFDDQRRRRQPTMTTRDDDDCFNGLGKLDTVVRFVCFYYYYYLNRYF